MDVKPGKITAAAAVSEENSDLVYISMLGRFEIRAGNGVVSDAANRSMKMWNFLAYIITNRGKRISHEEFFDLLWGNDDSESDNLISALKTLLYRVRAFLAPIDPSGELIIAQRGSYCLNPEVKCVVDVEQFERLCKRAAAKGVSEEEAIDYYAKALRLYRGDFLQKLVSELWVITLQTHYHTMYLNAVYSISDLLQARGLYGEMEDYCTKALQHDSMDEKLYCLLITALLRQGKEQAAMEKYKTITDLLYRNLGVKPSEELHRLYEEIMKIQKDYETDLSMIFEDLRESEKTKGAFYCEYGFFREAYRLEARRAARLGLSIYVALMTVSAQTGKMPPIKSLVSVMDHLEESILTSLRKGDVVAKYSPQQFVIMLPALTFEDGEMVMRRIIGAFYKNNRKNWMTISYKLQQIELAE
ncbi:MAG TPA: BTAD domain-containing putative transcriptional regulator [Oscillospiraceae bacterium]|nr:BTAD domain-containing putative transcriptional regulator [Oscillospiraceae bacterium]HPS35073.1 BTAD domain-containing putative transcriptional regulator [Oscillospiraceae bacterium]